MDAADYAYWNARLRGEDPPTENETPQCGWYAVKSNNGGPPQPLVIWRGRDGLIRAVLGRPERDESGIITNQMVCADAETTETVFRWFSFGQRLPRTQEAWRTFVDTGAWPGDDAAAVDVLTKPQSQLDGWLAQLADLEKKIPAYAKIETEDEASAATTLMQAIGAIRLAMDKAHKAEKEPHLRAGQAVDEKYRTPRQRAEADEKKIKAALSAYATLVVQRRREAEEKARALAEEKARAEAAKRIAETDDLDELLAAAPPPNDAAAEPEPEPAAPLTIATGYGRAASIRVKKIAVVEDYKVAAAAFLDPLHPDMKALVDKLVQQMLAAGFTPAGCKIEEVADVRR